MVRGLKEMLYFETSEFFHCVLIKRPKVIYYSVVSNILLNHGGMKCYQPKRVDILEEPHLHSNN